MTWAISWGGGLLLLAIFYITYNAFLHPLRHYPGPLLWVTFRFPYVLSIHRGDMHRKLKQFHDKYGPVVRIAPNELSYSNGAAWKDIYGNRPNHLPFKRNPTWFKKMSPDEPNSIMGPDEEAHARMRRAFANSFSDKSLRDQSPVIEGYVEAFMDKIKKQSTLDLNQWYNFLTFDISGDLSFGESFDCIKNSKAHPWVEIAQDFGKGLALISSINQYPPFDKLLRYIIPKKIMQRQLDHRQMSAAKARKRLALPTNRPDFVTPTLTSSSSAAAAAAAAAAASASASASRTPKTALSDREWEINMTILVFAGSETTASALSAITRQLVQNRGALHRLVREIRHAFDNETAITIASTTTGNLTYLDAVISEGLRLCPPAAIGVPRVVPRGGDTIAGSWVPGGTYVAVNQFSANRQERNFRAPNSFIPERFLVGQVLATRGGAAFQPFGVGRHGCVGVKLAWAELRLVLARLLFAFDVELADERDRWDWGEQDTFIFWDKRSLVVKLRRA